MDVLKPLSASPRLKRKKKSKTKLSTSEHKNLKLDTADLKMDILKSASASPKLKRKGKSKTKLSTSEYQNIKLDSTDLKMDILKSSLASPRIKRKRKSKTKLSTSEHKNLKVDDANLNSVPVTTVNPLNPTGNKAKSEEEPIKDYGDKYPVLKDQELVSKFLKVPMTNNQKGRIRQAIRDSLQGTANILVPEIIHNKITSILKSSANLTDSELRRIRILHNLLKTSLKGEDLASPKKVKKEKLEKSKKKSERDTPTGKEIEKDGVKKENKEQLVQKVRGPKRYIVFLGNLPLDVDKDKIMNHFSEMNEHIVDIRIPKTRDGKKSAIAYLEVSNEPSYEFALSKHHSMLERKRINVLYTAPTKGRVTKAEAKSKSAKLRALQKSGQLVGSLPLNKKRSQRRLKMKQAQAKLAETA